MSIGNTHSRTLCYTLIKNILDKKTAGVLPAAALVLVLFERISHCCLLRARAAPLGRISHCCLLRPRAAPWSPTHI